MAWFSWFKPGKPKSDAPTPGLAPKTQRVPRFDAVEIIPDPDGCCRAVRQLAGKRILAARVPLLPLKECDRPKCACAYRRYKDRRAGTRRMADMGVTLFDESLPADTEKRAPDTGRRRTDKPNT